MQRGAIAAGVSNLCPSISVETGGSDFGGAVNPFWVSGRTRQNLKELSTLLNQFEGYSSALYIAPLEFWLVLTETQNGFTAPPKLEPSASTTPDILACNTRQPKPV